MLTGAACGLAAAVLALAGPLASLDVAIYDRLFEWRGPRAVVSPIVIAAIDRPSIDALGPWPFPRAVHARAVDALARAGTRVIGFDVIFDVPSARGAADDEAFGAAIARAANVVLATASVVDVQPTSVREGYLMPLASIRRGAAAVGVITVSSNDVRRADVRDRAHFARTSGRPALTFAAQIARLAADGAPPHGDSPVLVNFRGPPGTFRRISYERIVRDAFSDVELRGAIVLVGTTDRAVPDHAATPFARTATMPGVEILANVVETLLCGNAIREMPRPANAAAALVAGLVAGALVAWYPGRAVVLTLALLMLAAASAYAVFVCCDVWFRFAGPGVALTAGLVLSIVARTRRTTASA